MCVFQDPPTKEEAEDEEETRGGETWTFQVQQFG